MSWAYDHLGLRPDADERDVKRAYARLLKETRPAEDPEGFQQLREAYEAALAQAARPEQALADEGGAPAPLDALPADPVAGPAPDAAPATRAEPEPPAVDPQPWTPPAATARVAAVDEPVPMPPAEPEPESERVTMTPVQIAHMLLEQAATLPTPAVRQWLADQPFLWQLDLKHAVADVLPWVLNEFEEPLFADSLDALWAFFDLDQVTDGAHVDRTYAFQHKRHELSLRWLLVDPNRQELTLPDQQRRLQAVWAPGFMGISYASAKLARHLGWASRPAALWLNVLRALWWGQTGHMARLLAWLSNEWQFGLVPPLDRGQLRFWLRAHDANTFSRERLAVVFAQYAAAMLVLLAPLVVLQVLIDGWGSFDWGLAAFMASWGLVVPLYRGLWSPLVHWQALPESAVERHAWWHVLCVPLFLLAGGLVRGLLDQPDNALIIWLWAGWLVYYRFRGRQGLSWTLGGVWWRWMLLLFAFKALVGLFGILLTAGYWVPAAVLALWGWELHKSRPLALERPAQAG